MTYGKLTPASSQSLKNYAEYLRIAKERGRSRRAAYDSFCESREKEFRLYTSGANFEKENRKMSTDNIAVSSSNSSHWAMQTIEIKGQDGATIALRPPGRFTSDTESESSSSPSFYSEESTQSVATLPKDTTHASNSRLEHTPRSLADALVAKILELDTENQLSLLQALEEADFVPKPIKQTSYPSGSRLTLVLRSNWGDPSYIGLHSLKIFSESGIAVPILSVTPSSAHSIVSQHEDSWTSEFDETKPVRVQVEFKLCKIKKISLSNFRAQRTMLSRGARLVDVFVDDAPVASVQVPKTPLLLTDSHESSIEVKF